MIGQFVKSIVKRAVAAVECLLDKCQVRWSWQNLSDVEDHGKIVAHRFPLHGRAWLYLAPDEDGGTLSIEWNLMQFYHAGVNLKFERDRHHQITFGLHLPPVSFFFSEDGVIERARLPEESRQCGVQWTADGLLVDVWSDPWSWDADDTHMPLLGLRIPRSFIIHPLDLLLGEPIYSQRTLARQEADIPLPERDYPALVSLTEVTWKRPRWPVAQRTRRADVKPLEGLPVPGKGEDAWNCGEDAIYEISFPATSITSAVAQTVRSVLRRREEYGGSAWKPEPRAAADAELDDVV